MSETNRREDAYEEILREHQNLRSLLDDLRKLFFERTVPFSEVLKSLQELQKMVEGHFRTEEDSGCFGDVVNHAPRVSDKVTALIAEHADLSVELTELVNRATGVEGASDDWDDVSTRFGEFTDKLMQHETTENELLQEVFTEDIGSKD